MLRIAVDFDGTIVEHDYPAIGKEKLFAFQTLREMQKRGFTLILWTYRYGKELQDAVDFCQQNGVEFYAVNKNYPEEIFDEQTTSRKIDADIYIDDKNLGGFNSWSDTWKIIDPDGIYFEENRSKQIDNRKKIPFLKRLFRKKSMD